MQSPDPGRVFEERALSVARAIHDPLGTQGPIIHKGQERDGLFIDDRTVAAFEFTVDRTKEKARKDAEKLAGLLRDFSSDPAHKHKAMVGYFVTGHEPTPDQRSAVEKVAQASRQQLRALSILTLQKHLIDAEAYIRLRLSAPFGSTQFGGRSDKTEHEYVEPTLRERDSARTHSLNEVIERTLGGKATVITADYGAGKSEALRQSFSRIRREYFKNKDITNLPVHINLNDCHGLRTPREVLQRHAEDIGFPNESSLVAAWRSGNVTLLLDGFDELVPTRWVGGARDLKQVRKHALEPVRRLIMETPKGAGILIAGRPQYFSTNQELAEALGLIEPLVLQLEDFDVSQVHQYSGDVSIPPWLPPRPLLLKFYMNFMPGNADADIEQAAGWRELISQVAVREADRIASLTRENVQRLICRVATAARTSGDALGPITVDEMRRVFAEVCGYEPEEEGLQLLLRLPGLNSTTVDASSVEEARRFIDVDFADAAYGEDLATHLAAPYEAHPLSSSTTWNVATGQLGAEVAAHALLNYEFDPKHVSFAIKKRMGDGHYDAALLDAARTADALDTPYTRDANVIVNEALIFNLRVTGTMDYVSQAQFSDCIIDTLDLTEFEDTGTFPTFRNCLIGHIEGWRDVPKRYESHFGGSEVSSFSGAFGTTDGLLSAGRTTEDSIALTILKKVYVQRGTGRKISALSRGVPPHDKGIVPEVLAVLETSDLVRQVSRGSIGIVLPVPKYREKVTRILEAPAGFSLSDL